ncbi:MAG: DUF2946 family protein [Xanthomonadaceae bacterium]|nr:DUF2946 family protein [Xanthomonadaceae bacterium]
MSPRLRHLLHSLSLLAIVLLSTVPTLGRIAEARRVPDAAALATRFCGSVHTSIHRLVALWQQEDRLQRAAAQGGDAQHPDCDYCPLLAALVSVALLLLALLRLDVARLGWVAISICRLRWHPCGLGSRGPPLAL